MSNLKIRAHHGICTRFFKGRGYSDGFSRHMAEIIEALNKNPNVELIACGDEICEKCPNLINGICKDSDKVLGYDTAVLTECGLMAGTEISWVDFKNLITRKIIETKKIRQICHNCQWAEICHKNL